MKQQTKFKFKAFVLYLLIEPWSSKVSLPNIRTISWLLIFIAIIFIRIRWLSILLLAIAALLYIVWEYRQGQFIYWYRNKVTDGKYGEFKEAVKEVRKKRRENVSQIL